MKICTKCKKEKDESEFNFNSQTKDGLSCWCKECRKFERTPEREFEKNLWTRFRMTVFQYELMFKKQNGVCAICGKSEIKKVNDKIQPLSVDHDHSTGKVRGLLCHNCNVRLRELEDLDWTPKAQAYLEKYK